MTKTATTPIAARRSLAEEECLSPIEIRCTQDGGDEELDVVWDWNSPQSRIKKTINRQRKRVLQNKSPQIPRKLPSKYNLTPKFTSLKAELEKLSSKTDETTNLKKEINLKEEDDDLVITLEANHLNDLIVNPLNPLHRSADDLFGDDSFDDEMVRCSQQVEDAFTKPQPKTIELLINTCATNIADDSFDAVLEDFTDEQIERLSQELPKTEEKTPVKSSRTIYRTHSTPVRSDKMSVFPRTKSANECTSPKSSLITCSPEEIEKKRLEAKAKLELKKAQKKMEKRRLEALEKLNKNRMQRTNNIVR